MKKCKMKYFDGNVVIDEITISRTDLGEDIIRFNNETLTRISGLDNCFKDSKLYCTIEEIYYE